MARQYQLISADSHLDLPPDRWTAHVPAKWRDRAPRRVKLENGEDAVIMEGRPLHRIGFTRISGVPRDQWHHQVPSYEGGLGTGSPEQRLREQDEDGVDAEVMFAHTGYVDLWRGMKEDDGFAALIHAYNEFLIEDYASAAPDRLIVMAVIPPTNVDHAVAELEYCARAGFKGVALYSFPNGKGYPLPEDDRFWAAAQDLGIAIAAHTNAGSTRFGNQGPSFKYPSQKIDKGDPIVQLLRFAGDSAFVPLQLAFMGVFERFPALRVYFAETQIGWLPYACVQIDDNYERYKYLFRDLYGLDWLPCPPSHYIRERCLWGFLGDPFGVRMRHDVGLQALMWGSDFAHAASDWPNSRRLIENTFQAVPADQRHQLLAGNAIQFFKLPHKPSPAAAGEGRVRASSFPSPSGRGPG
ncbi:MAG TPA: amidohydrolase family protein [Chloroflexota bacterium]|nr:amidohydrolase family protein [Chloroflexota bacterium]